jgi:hypothetical protein
VIAALRAIAFERYIVLEDFHYLPTEAQKDFAVALKAFHEASRICFIIVGVWLEENRLVVFNGDLTGRLIAIDADRWTEAELRRVIESGEKLLNVDFDRVFEGELIKESYGSVYIVQEACRQACIRADVHHTQATTKMVGGGLVTREIVKEVVDQQGGRYTASLQVAKDIKPIILDYVQTNSRLNVVDRGFVIWLQNQDKPELFGGLELPLQADSRQLSLDPMEPSEE